MDSPVGHIMQVLVGYWQSQALYVAAKLEVADKLAAGEKPVAELARETATHEDTLFRLLRALASIGIFQETSSKTFANTPASEFLRKDVPGSQWAMAVMMGEEHYRAWGELLYSVRTGKGAFEHVYGMRPFDYLATRPEQAAVFDAAMTSVHGRETGPLVAAYDFTSARVVADVGGGNGTVITAILQANPHLRGILYDLPHVIERARPNLERAGVLDRCQTIGGSFFDSVPTGADIYLMRHIIHDWMDDEAARILANCRQALASGGLVLVAETIVPPGNEPAFVKWLDLNMLVSPYGRERTREEYERLFTTSGLRLNRVIDTPAEIQWLEGVPA
jgi:SAM-dependent methyltransferase